MKQKLFLALIVILAFLVAWQWKTIKLFATSDPPTAEMVTNLEEQMGCAERMGFHIEKPTLRMMKEPSSVTKKRGLAYKEPNLILLAPDAPYETLAHELGHIVDFQTGRVGHPRFELIKKYSLEGFANVIRDLILMECRRSLNRP